MKILAIETSCDDTALTIFEVKGTIKNATFKILTNNSNSQVEIHVPYGGVYPMLAKREHIKNLPILLDISLKAVNLTPSPSPGQERVAKGRVRWKKPVDAITVTYGPGLEPCLWAGITFAQELAKKWSVPLVPVNHMEGHILSVFGKDKGSFKIKVKKSDFPTLALLVSGGHTQLVLSKKWMDYEIIGQTLDDAVGEAFDKVARMLDLPYPGGPQISKLAEGLRETGNQIFRSRDFSDKKLARPSNRLSVAAPKNLFPISLPRPMLKSKDFNFSFAGLKTAVLYLIKKIGKLDDKTKARIALEFENAAIECLTHKTKKAIEKYGVKTLIIAGGVAANAHLRSEMEKIKGVKVLFPTRLLSTDNSIMIGIAGYLNYIKNNKKVPKIDSIKATGNLRL